MSEETDNGNIENGAAVVAPDVDWRGQMAGGINMVTGFLKAIVVHDEYKIRDFLKNEYTFEAALRARTAIKASLMIDDLFAGKTDTETVVEAQALMVTGGWMAALRFVLRRVVEDPKSQQVVQDLYELIHPELVEAAQTADAKYCKAKKLKRKPFTHVLDLFEVDMLAEALMPFFARLATKIGAMLTRALNLASEPDSTGSSPANPSQP